MEVIRTQTGYSAKWTCIYKFDPALSAEFRIGGDFTNTSTAIWNAVNAPSPGSWNSGNNPSGSSRQPDIGSYQQQADYNGLIDADFIVKYTKDLNSNFNLDALAGVNLLPVKDHQPGSGDSGTHDSFLL